MQTCEQLKTQRNEFSERFGYLSHEMGSLRDLAQELKSGKPSAYHTQNHTRARPSVDQHQRAFSGPQNIGKMGQEIDAQRRYSEIESYTPYQDQDQESRDVNYNKVPEMKPSTIGVVSDDEVQRLEPIIEERYLHRQPKTTKNTTSDDTKKHMPKDSLGLSSRQINGTIQRQSTDQHQSPPVAEPFEAQAMGTLVINSGLGE